MIEQLSPLNRVFLSSFELLPQVPFFGTTDYSVSSQFLKDFAASHPALESAARRMAADLELADDVGLDVVSPERFFDDVRKWSAIKASGIHHVVVRKATTWFLHEFTRPEAREGYDYETREKADEESVLNLRSDKEFALFGGRPHKIVAVLPTKWRASEWVSVHLVTQYDSAANLPLSVSVWSPALQAWKQVSDLSEISNEEVKAAFTDLMRHLIGGWKLSFHREFFFHNSYRPKVSSFCVGPGVIVTNAPPQSAIVPEISFDAFSALVCGTLEFQRAHRRQQAANAVMSFANPAISSAGMPSLEIAIEAVLGDDRLSRRLIDASSRSSSAAYSLEVVVNALAKAHGIPPFPVTFKRTLETLERRRSGDPHALPPARKHFYKENLTFEEAAALKARYLKEGTAAFKGCFWNEYQPVYEPRDALPWEVMGTAVLKVDNVPHDEVIAKVLAFKPDAEPLMRAWREVWDRSFPDWQLREDWALDKVEKSFAASYAEWAKDEFEKAKKYKWEDWHSAAMADLAITTDKRDPRDYRLHIIDDADTVMSMAKLPAGMGILKVCRETVTFEGVDTDGLPRFSDSLRRDVSRERVERRMKGKPVYWNWPFFLRYLGRKIVVAPATHAGAIFWDMAQHGHTHAFIKLTEGKGTWTVNLSGIDSIEAGQKRLQATVSNSKDNYDLIIQEHVPFTHEHRFYVVDGRLFASACSDRNFCTLDASGRRLDDRVAVLNRPSIDNGYYDRGITSHVRDRQMSAKFAKKARQIAAELKQHGILDYSLDMGMTERGPICIEVNTLHRAGPYNLRRDLYMEAYSRKIATLAGRIHAELREKIRQMGVGKRLTNWAYDVLERNKSRLPDIANTQYDLLSDCSSSSDQVPIAVFDTLAQSILITALLEQPIPAFSELEDAA